MPRLSPMKQAYSAVVDFLKKCRSAKQISRDDWQDFRKRLEFIGLPPSMIEAIDLWTVMNLEQHRPEMVRWRVLHEVENQFIDRDSHGRILEAQFQGMISTKQLENMLEELASREYQPVSKEHMQNMLVYAWTRNIQGVRHMRPN